MNNNLSSEPITSNTELNENFLEFLTLLIEADLEQNNVNTAQDMKGEN